MTYPTNEAPGTIVIDPQRHFLYLVQGAREAVATSTGQNDSGLFTLDYNDPRYLPFEYMGAVSRWRIELPREHNFFALHTVTDVVLRLGHTAREGAPCYAAPRRGTRDPLRRRRR